MTDDAPGMPALSEELQALLAAERPVPAPPAGVRERVFARLGETLGWSGGGPSGKPGMGGAGALLLVVAALGIGGLGYYYVTKATAGGESRTQGAPGVPKDPRVEPRALVAEEHGLPGWFGDPHRTPRTIAGRVVLQGEPVAGARVILMSDAARAGLIDAASVTTGSDGRFDFGEHRAGEYDVSTNVPGKGFGYANVFSNDPVADPPSDQLTIRLPGCQHVLHGVVRDAAGGVVAGAEVLPAWNQWGWAYPRGAGTVTDARGVYELCTRAGPLNAVVRAQDYGSVTIRATVLDRRRFDVDLVPEAVIVGRVVRDNDEPVANVLIQVWPVWQWPDSRPQRLQTSNEVAVSGPDGRFRIAGVAPGRHMVFAADVGLVAGPMPVVVDSGQESSEIVLRVEDAAVVRGRVVEAGHPIPGARVHPVVDGNPRHYPVIADENGTFQLWLDLRPGTIGFAVEGYEVLAPAAHQATPTGRGLVTVDVAKLGAIRGRVLSRGRPVAEAEVEASGAALVQPAWARTDQSGAFLLRGLPPGSYQLQARSEESRASSTSRGGTTIAISSTEERSDVIIDLDGAASISGRVIDIDGEPVPAVRVRYADSASGDACEADTGDGGEFTCDMLVGGGTYRAAVRPDGASALQFAPAEAGALAAVALRDGTSHVYGQVLRVRAARARISGRVVDASGGGRPDVSVRALDASAGYAPDTAPWVGLRTVLSGTDGWFALDVWKGGAYTLHARAPDGSEGVVAAVAAGAAGVVVRLDDVGSIRGTLVGFDAVPEVMIRRIGNTIDVWRAVVRPGSFAVDALAPGRYAVLAVAGAQGAGEEIEVRTGAATTLALRPRPTIRLAGTVVDFRTGQPVPGVRCKAAPYVRSAGIGLWGTRFAEPTDAQGHFALAAPSGSIEVTCEPRPAQYDTGAARLITRPGEVASVTVPIVVSSTTSDQSNGIGARWVFSHDDAAGGYRHTVGELRPGGSAATAGLAVGDQVIAVEGRDVRPLVNLDRLLGTFDVGASVDVRVLRAGSLHSYAVSIEPRWR